MARTMHLSIIKMDYTLFDGFLEHMKAEFLPPSFKLDKLNGECVSESHLVFRSDTMNLCIQQSQITVRISNTSGGGFNLRIGCTDMKLHMIVGSHVNHPTSVCCHSSLRMTMFVSENTSWTGGLPPDCLKLLLLVIFGINHPNHSV
jgi:hypothetical protein